MNRRSLIKNVAIAATASILPLSEIFSKATKPVSLPKDGAGFKRFSLGKLELTILTDGHIVASPVQPFVAPKATKEAVETNLKAAFRPTDSIDLAMNVLLVRSEDRLILLDAGMGIFASESEGWLLQSLERAHISVDAITDIMVSHAHPDHIGGLVSKDNQLVFPHATIHISKIEYDFWLKATLADFSKSELRHQPDFLKQIIPGIQKTLNLVKNKIRFIDIDKPLYDCFTFQLAPGHTPGLTLVTVYSGTEKLIYIADLIHSDALLFAHPEWGFSGDTDIDLATASRVKVLKQLADHRMRTFAYHLPWPGLGYVKNQDRAFAWVPDVFSTP